MGDRDAASADDASTGHHRHVAICDDLHRDGASMTAMATYQQGGTKQI